MLITLADLIEHIPDHAKMGIVIEEPDVKYGTKFHTLYSGYRKTFMQFCNHQCVYPYGYEVTTIHAGSWDNKKGLVIGVKYIDNEKK